MGKDPRNWDKEKLAAYLTTTVKKSAGFWRLARWGLDDGKKSEQLGFMLQDVNLNALNGPATLENVSKRTAQSFIPEYHHEHDEAKNLRALKGYLELLNKEAQSDREKRVVSALQEAAARSELFNAIDQCFPSKGTALA